MSLLLLFKDQGGAPPPSLAYFTEIGRSVRARKPTVWTIRPTLTYPEWEFAWRRRPHLVLPMWEGSGDRCRDFSSFRRHATGASATARPAWVATPYGRGLVFDEVDDRMTVDAFQMEANQDTVTPAFTVLCVFHAGDNLGTQFQYLFSWGILSNTSTLNCYIREGSNASDPGEVTTQIRCVGAGSASTFTSGVRVDDSLWHTVAITLDTARKYDLYIDGVRRNGSAALSGTGGFDPATFDLRIGANTLSGEGVSSDRFFGGTMAFFAIFRGAWNALNVREWAKQPMGLLHSTAGIVVGLPQDEEGFMVMPETLGPRQYLLER